MVPSIVWPSGLVGGEVPAHSCSFTHTQLDGTGWSAAKMAKDAFPTKPVPQGAELRAGT